MKLQVQTREGKLLATVDVDDTATVKELKKAVHAARPRLHPARQRLTLPQLSGAATSRPVVLDDGQLLSTYLLADGGSVVCKDLGPQVGYSTVFFWEYFGPLVVYPLFYFLPQHVAYPTVHAPLKTKRLPVQTLALAYWSLHYTKRIIETFTIHKFGHDTMPVANLFRNCAYYWTFAAYVSYFINHPLYTAPPLGQTLVCLALALGCQLGNFRSHVILANLRAPGDKGYKIPSGGAFDYVTCANYMFEVYGWALFSLGVQAVPAAIFTVVGAVQMIQWALQKHARLRKLFDGKEGRPKYPRRWVMLPPLL